MAIKKIIKRCPTCNEVLVPDTMSKQLKKFTGKEYMCISCKKVVDRKEMVINVEDDVKLFYITDKEGKTLLEVNGYTVAFGTHKTAFDFALAHQLPLSIGIFSTMDINKKKVTNGEIVN